MRSPVERFGALMFTRTAPEKRERWRTGSVTSEELVSWGSSLGNTMSYRVHVTENTDLVVACGHAPTQQKSPAFPSSLSTPNFSHLNSP